MSHIPLFIKAVVYRTLPEAHIEFSRTHSEIRPYRCKLRYANRIAYAEYRAGDGINAFSRQLVEKVL